MDPLKRPYTTTTPKLGKRTHEPQVGSLGALGAPKPYNPEALP